MQWQLPHLANDCMFGRDRPNNKQATARKTRTFNRPKITAVTNRMFTIEK